MSDRDERLMAAMGYPVSVWGKLSEWDKFGELWKWAREQDWWGEFVRPHMLGTPFGCYDKVFILINPDRFANAVDEYLQGRVVEV